MESILETLSFFTALAIAPFLITFTFSVLTFLFTKTLVQTLVGLFGGLMFWRILDIFFIDTTQVQYPNLQIPLFLLTSTTLIFTFFVIYKGIQLSKKEISTDISTENNETLIAKPRGALYATVSGIYAMVFFWSFLATKPKSIIIDQMEVYMMTFGLPLIIGFPLILIGAIYYFSFIKISPNSILSISMQNPWIPGWFRAQTSLTEINKWRLIILPKKPDERYPALKKALTENTAKKSTQKEVFALSLQFFKTNKIDFSKAIKSANQAVKNKDYSVNSARLATGSSAGNSVNVKIDGQDFVGQAAVLAGYNENNEKKIHFIINHWEGVPDILAKILSEKETYEIVD